MKTNHFTHPSRSTFAGLAALVCLMGIATVAIAPSLVAEESTKAASQASESPATSSTEAKAEWVTEGFGRPDINVLHWSVDPAVTKAFEPSGIGSHIVRCGEFTVLYNHGLYWSGEENQDDTKDMQASVMIFKGEQRVFVARGYDFVKFNFDAATNALTFTYWTGVQGDKQLVLFTMALTSGVPQVEAKFFSTKD